MAIFQLDMTDSFELFDFVELKSTVANFSNRPSNI